MKPRFDAPVVINSLWAYMRHIVASQLNAPEHMKYEDIAKMIKLLEKE